MPRLPRLLAIRSWAGEGKGCRRASGGARFDRGTIEGTNEQTPRLLSPDKIRGILLDGAVV